MKKLLNVILASFLVLGMIGCANAAGGDSGSMEGFKATAGENGVVLTLPKNLPTAECYKIGKHDCDTKEENYWLNNEYMTFYDKSKESVIDYFVEPNHRYNYVLYCRNGKEIIATSEIVEVIPTAGIGELVLNPSPKATFSNNKMTFSQLPVVPDSQKEKLQNGFLGLVYMTQDIGSRTLVIDFSKTTGFTGNVFDCSNKLYGTDRYNKPLDIFGSQGSVTIDNVEYYRVRRFDTDVPKVITVTK